MRCDSVRPPARAPRYFIVWPCVRVRCARLVRWFGAVPVTAYNCNMSAICVRLCATWLCRGRGARPGFSLGAPCGCAPPRAGLGRARVASRASPRPRPRGPGPGGRARKTGTPTARGPDSVLPLFYSTATLPRSENYHLRLKRAVAYRLARLWAALPFVAHGVSEGKRSPQRTRRQHHICKHRVLTPGIG